MENPNRTAHEDSLSEESSVEAASSTRVSPRHSGVGFEISRNVLRRPSILYGRAYSTIVKVPGEILPSRLCLSRVSEDDSGSSDELDSSTPVSEDNLSNPAEEDPRVGGQHAAPSLGRPHSADQGSPQQPKTRDDYDPSGESEADDENRGRRPKRKKRQTEEDKDGPNASEDPQTGPPKSKKAKGRKREYDPNSDTDDDIKSPDELDTLPSQYILRRAKTKIGNILKVANREELDGEHATYLKESARWLADAMEVLANRSRAKDSARYRAKILRLEEDVRCLEELQKLDQAARRKKEALQRPTTRAIKQARSPGRTGSVPRPALSVDPIIPNVVPTASHPVAGPSWRS